MGGHRRTPLGPSRVRKHSIHSLAIHLAEARPTPVERIIIPPKRLVNDGEQRRDGTTRVIREVNVVDPRIHRDGPPLPLELPAALAETDSVGAAVRVGVLAVPDKTRVGIVAFRRFAASWTHLRLLARWAETRDGFDA
ncbi:hypothetical protein PG988_003916 [Apiospora saccharicola]